MDFPHLLDGRLKLRHLILVSTLSSQRSMIAAAAELHVTQPVVTRTLHEVEEILGVTLYERSPRGITPTVFGLAFTEHARAVIAQLTQAARHVAEIADGDRGDVVVGLHLAGSNLLLPKAIAALNAQHPFLTVIVREAGPEALLVDLKVGRVDVIVGRLDALTDERLTRSTLYEESVNVVVGSHHPAARQRKPSLDALLDYPWIIPGGQSVLRGDVEEYFVRNRVPLPPRRIETTSFLTARRLLIDTEMIAILPSRINQDDPMLSVLPVELENVGHSVGITLAAERTLRPGANALIEQLRIAGNQIQAEHHRHTPAIRP